MTHHESHNEKYDTAILDALTVPIAEAIDRQTALTQGGYENIRTAFANEAEFSSEEVLIRNIAEQLGLESSINGARAIKEIGGAVIAPWVIEQSESGRYVRHVGLWALRETVDITAAVETDDQRQEVALSVA